MTLQQQRVMCVQREVVAITFGHDGGKFHSFAQSGCELVHIYMELCEGGYVNDIQATHSTVTEFLSSENGEIYHHLKAVHSKNTVQVNCWVIKVRQCGSGNADIVDQPHSGRPVLATD